MKNINMLMDQIKACKNKDLQQIEVLCGDLIELGNQYDDFYALAFANTY